MKITIKHLTNSIATLFVFLLLPSCKENTIIKANVAPSIDNIHVFQLPDTCAILCKSVWNDSAVTSYSSTGIPIIHALGYFNNDKYAGAVNASIYFQLVPPTPLFTLNTGEEIDSAVLILPVYTSFAWGDTLTGCNQTYRVYKITDSSSTSSIYYTNTVKAIDNFQLGSVTINTKNLNDSVTLKGGNKVAPHLRIKLNNAFISTIKNTFNQDSNYNQFLDAFRGLAIQPDVNGAANNVMPYFRLDGTTGVTTDYYNRANVLLYVHNGSNDSIKYSYSFNSGYCSHFNNIKRTITNPTVNSYINTHQLSDSLLLLHNLPGGEIDVVFPNIKSLPNAVINKAELIITMAIPVAGDTLYSAPSRIYPLGITDSNTRYAIADRYPVTETEPLDFIDGLKKTVSINGTNYYQYTLNFPRELQKAMIEQRSSLHLRIGGTATFLGAYRLLAAGRNHPNNNISMKFNVIYTKQ